MSKFLTIEWNTEDIKDLRPDWSDEKIKKFAFQNSARLEDFSVSMGWECLNDLLREEEYLNNEK